MAKAKPAPKTAKRPAKRRKVKVPWLPLLLALLGLFGFWVAPTLWDKTPVQVVFEDSK